ncbi:sugar transporter [Actinoplanes sp. KI2]|uniref:lipopolysaccharide biosynthesis protein n=1 Tax=Actinoplanes sp. KI2 TaxID=2983315 RepID=UPI0021D5A815|nr:sugar transporter [Actinoplanes sp. KI2]MCU7728546.1 sugar transporter [Actinoplanes sp. KI2]
MLARVGRDSLARNSVLIMASTVGASGLGYLYWMVAARELPRPAIGTATALISAATVVSMVANLGLGHMFIQRLPGAPARVWSRIVSAGLLLGCAATAAAALAAALVLPRMAGNFDFLDAPAGVVALVATAVAQTASMLLDYVFVAHRASQGMLWRSLTLAGGKVLTLAGLTATGFGSAWTVVLAWTLPSIAVTGYTLRRSLPRLRPGCRLAGAGLGAELPYVRGSLTGHHLINLAQAGPSALLPVLVTARLGADANAHFYMAWMTASVLFMVSPAVASALYAERTNEAGRSASLPRAALVVLAVIGAPATGLFLAGGWILTLFSPAYAVAGAALLKILVLAAIPDAITNLAVAHWRSVGALHRCLRLNLLMAACCLSLTWLWLPAYGIEATGYAWLVGQALGALTVAVHAMYHSRSAAGPASPRPAPHPRQPTAAQPPHSIVRARPAMRFRARTRPSPHSRPRTRSWRAP